MSKQSPFAREEVMEAYLDSLLKEPETPEDVTARTAKLLEQASQQMTESALTHVDELKTEADSTSADPQTVIAEKVTAFIETEKVEVSEDEAASAIEPQVESQNETALSDANKTKIPLKDTLVFKRYSLRSLV